ncbi:ABC transporter ATP-binding protein [Natronosporangium hydrolyticum]|uniref:ABC transporter ATP-binding protein n=1 Tax=Natronosporangium hydrolyticum TaxID=2811111 RepID=A0A895YGJ6_9ACTN|nr:ABC transporter ATP-binding protein [Natronosporangium hydrolyticum]QSB17004.1 ABC transporter ATP-binding protein [Natronosporangium hydrolyticum]
MLEVERLSKNYGEIAANIDLTFTVKPGEVVALLGSNGAGKTTLVHQVVGLTRPTSGSIRLDGSDLIASPRRARWLCSLQPQSQVPLTGLTPRRSVEIVGELRGLSTAAARERAERIGKALALEGYYDRRVQAVHLTHDALSSGMRRLVAFCMAAVAPCRALVLDEPTNDVDPLRRTLLWQIVRDIAAEGTCVLLVTHNVLEAARIVDKVILMDAGRIIAQGKPDELSARYCPELVLEVVVTDPTMVIDRPTFVESEFAHGHGRFLGIREEVLPEALAWARGEQDARRITRFSVRPSTLNDAYGHIVDALRDREN